MKDSTIESFLQNNAVPRYADKQCALWIDFKIYNSCFKLNEKTIKINTLHKQIINLKPQRINLTLQKINFKH